MMSAMLRICEIIIIFCLLAVSLEGKSLKALENNANDRSKRGFAHYGGNDFSSSIELSSPVLQYADSGHQHSVSSLDSSSHFESAAVNDDPWSASGLSPGYEVYLEPSSHVDTSSALDISSHALSSSIGSSDIISSDAHASSLGSIQHPSSDYITSSAYSGDSAHSGYLVGPSSQLHTQISSSSGIGYGSDIGGSIHDDHGISLISDNIDFNNVADIKSKHYSKSYGK